MAANGIPLVLHQKGRAAAQKTVSVNAAANIHELAFVIGAIRVRACVQIIPSWAPLFGMYGSKSFAITSGEQYV